MSSEEDLPIHDGRTIPDVPPVPKNYVPKEIAQEGAEPAPAPEEKKSATQARRRVGASSTDLGKPRRSGRTEKLVQEAKDAKPPSKVGRAIKKTLLLLIPILIVGLTVAGFFVKNPHTGDTVWIGVAKTFGLIKEKDKNQKKDAKPQCPEVLAFGAVSGLCEEAEDAVKLTRSQMQDRPEWTKEQAEQARAKLETAWKRIDGCSRTIEEFTVFFSAYQADYAALQQADEAKDQAKLEELNAKLRRTEYADIAMTDGDVDKVRMRWQNARARLRSLLSEFPTLDEIAKGALPKKEEPKKEEPKKEEPKKEEPKEFDAAALNPYARISAGQWRRDEVVQAGALNERKFLQDVVWEEVKEGQYVVARTYLNEDGRISDTPPMRLEFQKVRLLGVEKVGVGGVEYECQLVEVGPTKVWIARGGPWPDRIAVKLESEQTSLTATELGTKTLTIKGSEVKCAYVELKGKIANQDAVQRNWYSDAVPTGAARSEYEIGDNKGSSTLVDFGDAPRPKFEGETAKTEEPKKEEPKKEEPKKKELPKQPGPWANFAPGTWARMRSTFKQGTIHSESWMDKTLLRSDGGENVFKYDYLTSTGDESSEEKPEPVEAPQPSVVGEETVTVDGTDYPCLIAESGSVRMWISADGIALKIRAGSQTTTVTKIGQEQLVIQGRGFTCLYTESERSDGAKTKTWMSREIPGYVGRTETEKPGQDHASTTIFEVTAFGEGTKPGFKETAKVEEPKKEEPKKEESKKEEPVKKEKTADDFVKDGDGFLGDASRQFTEVSKACREGLPAEKGQLQTLKEKADSAETNFRAAIDAYTTAKEKGADGAKMDDKISRIQRLLGLHKRNQEAIDKKIAE